MNIELVSLVVEVYIFFSEKSILFHAKIFASKLFYLDYVLSIFCSFTFSYISLLITNYFS
jgi:hypothetical protein